MERAKSTPSAASTPMSVKDLKKHLPRAPLDDEGYMTAFNVNDSQGYLEFLKTYGFCVVRLLSPAECDDTVRDMFAELNRLASHTGTQKCALSPNDPNTWDSENWPDAGKFCVKDLALSQKAFENRTHPNLYKIYREIFGTSHLYSFLDHWGIMRGTKELEFRNKDGTTVTEDRPGWRYELPYHWDVNPWKYAEARAKGEPPLYQSLIALVDCPEEVGGFITLPGCTGYLSTWTARVKEPLNCPNSYHISDNDPLVSLMQRVPVRKGDLIIWDSGQLHSNFQNFSSNMRLVQYVRMLPATAHSLKLHPRAGPLMCTKQNTSHLQLTPLARKLLGLDSWEK